ncbi:uncharacterized protein LOC127102891 [Lathyrus oleraceus]|uniref:uncharacterized protein LOC127102891 n=1 Tax=Pisum sativum TaxID=3888 RepID=UPI0021D2680E|nr:uncharacterized protein LOC127102891 [Pisum sativum]
MSESNQTYVKLSGSSPKSTPTKDPLTRRLKEVARKPPVSPLQIQKPTATPITVDSNEDDMSPILDLTSRKRKPQPKPIDPSNQPNTKLSRKRFAALVIQEPTPEEMARVTAAQSESDNSSPKVEGYKGDASTIIPPKKASSSKPASMPDVLNSTDEPTYRPSSKKWSMSEINQPPTGTLDASPPKTTTQHYHTSDSGHETDSSEENEAQGNQVPMVEDELDDDEETPGAGLHTAAEMNEPQSEGWGVEDMVVEKANEGNLATNPDNIESQTKRRANVGEEHAQTQTPAMADNPTVGVSSSSIGVISAEKLVILKRSQPLEYLKAMLNCRESYFDQSHNTSMSEDQPSSTSAGEILSKIKDKVFKGDLFLLLLVDPSAPLTLKALLI